MTAGAMAVLAVAVMAAGGVQRLTGLGFTLVASPITVLVLGPWDGITVMFLLGTGVCLFAAWQTRSGLRNIRAFRLCISAFIGVIPGVMIAYAASDRVLGLAVAVMILAALALVVATPSIRWRDGRRLQYTSGLACGALGGLAGSGGPPLVLYGTVTEKPARDLVPLMQAVFSVVGLEALVLRGALNGSLVPALPGHTWALLALAVVVGDRAGVYLSARVRDATARIAMVSVAGAGAVALLIRSLTY